MNSILDNYDLPEVAVEALKRHNVREVSIGDGVTRLTSGHDGGVSFRFWNYAQKNELRTKLSGYPCYDNIDMISWAPDRFSKEIPEQVRFLPPELLEIHGEEDGEIICSGRYAEAFKRYKKGMTAPGLPLSKWNVLSDADVATLAEAGIFSVEQLAALPRSKIEGRYPKVFVDAFEEAILYVRGKEGRADSEKQTGQLVTLMQENSKLNDTVRELQEQMKQLLTGAAKTKKGKEKEEDGN
jgi:hypothetical protein